jgi:cytochrome P450
MLKRFAARYGDPFRLVVNGDPMTTTGDPDCIRAIYTADPDSLGVWGVEVTEPVFGRSSVVVTRGERHKRDRKLLTAPFGGSSMRSYGATMAEVALTAASRWRAGERLSMLQVTQSITLDLIVRVVFGMEGSERVRRTRHAVLRLIGSLNPLIIAFPQLRRELFGVGPWAKNRRALRALNELLAEEIQARRGTSESRKDILSLMMRARYDDGTAMSDTELIEQLRAVLFAGHETTGVALAWAFHHLHDEPAYLATVLEEIDGLGHDPDPDSLASLPFLEAVCQEVLRLRPPVTAVARIAIVPFQLGRFTIPAGEGIRPSPLLLHARPDLYPEPDRFRPSRFLERKFSPFEYIPFGGGARRCLGAAFALYEMKVVLGTLLGKYRFRLESDKRAAHVRRGLTFGPRDGVPMALLGERRAPSS